jgi:hypothetical protein
MILRIGRLVSNMSMLFECVSIMSPFPGKVHGFRAV